MFDEVRNAGGERLDATFHPAPGRAGGRLVVIGHGVTANKDRPFLVALAEGLAAAGTDALRFSFSGNGRSEGRFEDSTVTKEVADLGAILDAAGERPIVYAGHSMGGAVGLLRAADDRRIERLVSLAGMVDTASFARRKFGDLTPGRDAMWDKPECPLSQTFLDDMAAHGDLLGRAAGVTVPWLLVHGTADAVVPIEESRRLVAAGDPRQLVELDGADHLFEPGATPAMVEAVVGWLVR